MCVWDSALVQRIVDVMCNLVFIPVHCYLLQESLGVSKKPDAISTWSGPLDSESQDSIRSDCVRMAGE